MHFNKFKVFGISNKINIIGINEVAKHSRRIAIQVTEGDGVYLFGELLFYLFAVISKSICQQVMIRLTLVSYKIAGKEGHLKSVEQHDVQYLFAHGLNGAFNQLKRSRSKIGRYQYIAHTVIIKLNNEVYSSKAGILVLE